MVSFEGSTKAYRTHSRGSLGADRHKHHESELARIISGIKEDNDQELVYPDTAQVELGLAKRLTRNEDTHSRIGSLASLHRVRSCDVEMGKSANDCRTVEDDSPDSASATDTAPSDDGPPMDTGFAWVMAVCAMFAVFGTWGASAGYGVFLSYYMSADAFAGATEYDYALVGSLIVCLAQLLAPICVLSYKVFGPFWTLYFGIFLQTLGFILASFATLIWQLYCTQGLIVGVSFLFVFLPATLMLPTWFDKRRATAMGIAVSGAGVGGVFFSLTIQKLIEVTGDQKWALRMCGLVTGVVTLCCCSIMKPRNYKPLPLKVTLTREFIGSNARAIFSISPFKDYALSLLGLWFGLVLLGYVLVLYTVSAYGILVGLTRKQGSTLTAVLNAGQAVGRPSCGFIADRIGRFNYTIVNCVVIAVLIWAFWMNATSYGALIVFSILIGLIIGVGSLFCQPLASDILQDPGKLPPAWSGLNIIVLLFCMASEVTALGIRDTSSPTPYKNTQVFGGVCFMAGGFILSVIREKIVRKQLVLWRQTTSDKLHNTTKSGHLKKCVEEDIEVLEARLERYNLILSRSPKFYFFRMFYPTKV